MNTSTTLGPSYLTLERLTVEAQPTLGSQQVKMALAALTPPPQRAPRSAFGAAWVVAPALPIGEPAAVDRAPQQPVVRHVERRLRCPYCRSMTYEVRVTAHPRGWVASGACTLCGTHGESFRPAGRRRAVAAARPTPGV